MNSKILIKLKEEIKYGCVIFADYFGWLNIVRTDIIDLYIIYHRNVKYDESKKNIQESLLEIMNIANSPRYRTKKNQISIPSEQTYKKSSINFIGESPEHKRIIKLANEATKADTNILIQGESGTGKEILARYIHKNSARKNNPFVVLNCALLPDQLIESELFGHEKDVFTSAKIIKNGIVEIADGGILFLDEISELSLSLQSKLLRFLETEEYRRIGGVANLTSNIRVIAATNKNLMEEVKKNNFQKDLLLRLNAITLTIPPLRDRQEDILPLANYFLETMSPIYSFSPKKLSPRAKDILLAYSFKGNIRELENIIERAILLAEGEYIQPDDLYIINLGPQPIISSIYEDKSSNSEDIMSIEEVEKRYIERALIFLNWNKTKAAAKLGISIKELYKKIKKYEIDVK